MFRLVVVLGIVAACGDNKAPGPTFVCTPFEEPLPGVSGLPSSPARALTLSTDLDKDGKLDLVTLSGRGEPVASVLLGNGDATFQDPIDYYGVGYGDGAFAVGDFDRDGNADIAVASLGDPDPTAYLFGSKIYILFGNGDGTLRPGMPISVGDATEYPYYFGVAVSDFNNDSRLDLLVGTNHVMLGNGDGTFQPVLRFDPGDASFLIGVDDVNTDGRVDIVLGAWSQCPNMGGVSGCQGVEVRIGNGDGTFQISSGFATQPQTDLEWVRLLDLTGDNVPDLVGVVSGDQSGDLLAVRRGNRDGTFESSSRTSPVSFPAAMAFGDLDRNGTLDLAVTHTYGGDSVSILLGQGDGTFGPAVEYAAGGHRVGNVTIPDDHPIVADFDGDQNPDVVAGLMLRGNGDGTLQSWRIFPTAPDPTLPIQDYNAPVSTADLDGDGLVDVVVASFATISISRAIEHGLFDLPTGITLHQAALVYAIATSDLNHDGAPDIAAVQQDNVAVLLNNRDGTFGPEIDSSFTGGGYYWSQSFGDLDGDGNVDLVMVGAGSLMLMLGNGDGTFRPGGEVPLDQTCTPGTEAYHSVQVADIDDDHVPDLVVTSGAIVDRSVPNPPTLTCFGVSVFYGTGAGLFGDERDLDPGDAKTYALIADADGDGLEDVLAVGGDVRTFLGAGGRRFSAPKVMTAPSGFGGTYNVADIDGDGLLDLVVAGDSTLDIYPGKGDGTFGTVTSVNVGATVASFALTDLNADGAPDLLVPFRGGNEIGVLLRSCGPGD